VPKQVNNGVRRVDCGRVHERFQSMFGLMSFELYNSDFITHNSKNMGPIDKLFGLVF